MNTIIEFIYMACVYAKRVLLPLLLLLLCVAILLLKQLLLFAAADLFGVPDGQMCWCGSLNLIPAFLFSSHFFGSSIGGTVAFMTPICQIYIHGNGHTRIPGGRQPAAAMLAFNCIASYVQHTAVRL